MSKEKKHQATVSQNEDKTFSAKCWCGFESGHVGGHGAATKAATGHGNKK